MKKKILAMLLAVVMAAGLLPTAFAADGEQEPGITMNVKDPDALRIEGTTFRLQDWDFGDYLGEEAWFIGVPADRTSESLNAHELPLGVTLTVEMADPGYGVTNGSSIGVDAWSDPDGDGVYNRRVYSETREGLLPADETGPFKGDEMLFSGGYFFVNGDGVVNGDGYSGINYAPSNSWTIPTTFQIPSDYLTEYYGAHTLVHISILTDRDTWTYDEYYFLLTGEQADPDLVGEPEEPTEPEKPTEPEITFPDVHPGDYHADAVAWAVKKGFITGYDDGMFHTDIKMTSGMLVTLLARLDGEDTTGGSLWYDKGVEWARAKGVYDVTAPGDDATREQMVTMLWRYAGRPSSDTSILDNYPDSSDVHDWPDFREAMAWAVGTGLVKGDGVHLMPLTTTDRGQAVTLFLRYYDMLDKT